MGEKQEAVNDKMSYEYRREQRKDDNPLPSHLYHVPNRVFSFHQGCLRDKTLGNVETLSQASNVFLYLSGGPHGSENSCLLCILWEWDA